MDREKFMHIYAINDETGLMAFMCSWTGLLSETAFSIKKRSHAPRVRGADLFTGNRNGR